MDIATIIGLVSTFTLVAIGFEDQPGRLIHLTSLIVVVMGTVTTLLTSFPLSDLVYAPFQALRLAIIPPAGAMFFLAREKLTEEQMQAMLPDLEGEEPSPEAREKIENDLQLGVALFARARTLALAWGVVACLIRLVVLPHGSAADGSWPEIGSALAIPLLYGALIGWLFCLPIENKLSRYLALMRMV